MRRFLWRALTAFCPQRQHAPNWKEAWADRSWPPLFRPVAEKSGALAAGISTPGSCVTIGNRGLIAAARFLTAQFAGCRVTDCAGPISLSNLNTRAAPCI
jgi:hypothetical protein